MQVVVSGQNIDMTEALKSYSEKKIGKIDHYFSEAIEKGKVELVHHKTKSPEKSNEAKVLVFVHGAILTAREEHADMYAAIDLLFEKLEKQLKKYKDKLKNHKNDKVAVAIDKANRQDEIEYSTAKDNPIIYTVKQRYKPMMVEEAAMQLQLSNMEFLTFLNAETESISVIYKRKDGDYNLIESQN